MATPMMDMRDVQFAGDTKPELPEKMSLTPVLENVKTLEDGKIYTEDIEITQDNVKIAPEEVKVVPEVIKTTPQEDEITLPVPIEKKTLAEVKIQIEPEVPQDKSNILHELQTADRLSITRRMKMKSILCLSGKRNTFYVTTPGNTELFTVHEDSNRWIGYCCFGLRPLHLKVLNRNGTEVIHITRPYNFTTRIFPCQLQSLTVCSPPERVIGYVKQEWTPASPLYAVKNADGEVVFYIRGPCMTLTCFHDLQFHIMRPDGTHVGATCKRWQGVFHAVFFAPIRDKYGLSFDKNLKADEKALLLAATLLFDYMYYDDI